MCGPYFNFSATKASQYHVHIYFDDQSELNRFEAETLMHMLLEKFPGKVTGGYEVGKIGPHTRANFEVDIKPEAFGDVIQALQLAGTGLSILIHPRTGDELFDHKKAAMWLGVPVAFNEMFFDSLRKVQQAEANAAAAQVQAEINQRLKVFNIKPPKR